MDWSSKQAIGAVVGMIRGAVQEAAKGTISDQQKKTLKDPGIKGQTWAAKLTLQPPPEDDVRQLLLRIIDKYNEHDVHYTRPPSRPLQMEWIGYRKEVAMDTTASQTSEIEKYHGLIRDTSGSAVVMFLYGGAFYQASYRKITTQLSKRTGLPVVTVHQRLAPQNPFPAALLDVFHGYISLLSPPPGSPQKAYPASSILIAGDSSGSALALGLLQILLEAKRLGISTIKHHNRTVDLLVPAGFTLLSPVGDLTNALPSFTANADKDVFPEDPIPCSLPDGPSCDIWPSKPPRGTLYCENKMMYHPITAPAMAQDWKGSPPLWFASGEEQSVDGAKIVAKVAAGQGVQVYFQEYEAMPHCFMWILADSLQYKKCWDDWTSACMTILAGKDIRTGGQFVCVEGLESKDVEVEDLTHLTVFEARRLIVEAAENLPIFTGQKGGSKL